MKLVCMLAQSSTPNQTRSMPSLLGRRRQQRDDDEGDLEEIEEERQHEDEDVDEDQEADDAAGQRRSAVLDPVPAADALEHQAEDARAEQDEDHHRGDPHGRLHALPEQRPGQAAVHRGEHERADRRPWRRLRSASPGP